MGSDDVAQCHLPPQIEEMVLFACNLWIDSGHDIHNYQFVSNFIHIFLEEARQSGSLDNDDSLCIDQPHRDFVDSHPDLKAKVQLAKKKKKPKANYRQWLSLVEPSVKRIHPASGCCIFTAREFGLITEKTRWSKVASVQRPKNAEKDRHKVVSALYLMSMTGEFYPPHVMMRNEEALPTDYQEWEGFKVASNQTGWASRQDWLNWLVNEFDPATQKYTDGGLRWRLLFVDSYYSPIKEEFFVESYKRGILCVGYPTSDAVDKIDPFSCGEIFYDVDRAYSTWLQSQWENRGTTNVLHVPPNNFLRIFAHIIFEQRQSADWEAQVIQAWQKSQMSALLSAEQGLDNHISTPHVMQVPESQPVAENVQRKVERDSVIACESQHHTSRPVNDEEEDYEDKAYESVLVEMAVDDFESNIVDHDMDGRSSQRRKRSFDEFSVTADTSRSHQRPRYGSPPPCMQFELPIRSLNSPHHPQSNIVHPTKVEPPDLTPLSPPTPPTPIDSVHSHDSPDNPAPSQALSPREGTRQAYHCLAQALLMSDNDTSRKSCLEMMGGLVDKLATLPCERAPSCSHL